MRISYDKLWKLLIDLKINRTTLMKKAEVSSNVMARLGKNESVSTESLSKICKALNCNIGDIMDFIEE